MSPAPKHTVRRAIVVAATVSSMAWSCAGDDTATAPPGTSRQERPTTSAMVPGPTEVSTTPASTPPSVDTIAQGPLVDRPWRCRTHLNDDCALTLQTGHVPGRLDPIRTVSCDPYGPTAPGTPDPADPSSTAPTTT